MASFLQSMGEWFTRSIAYFSPSSFVSEPPSVAYSPPLPAVSLSGNRPDKGELLQPFTLDGEHGGNNLPLSDQLGPVGNLNDQSFDKQHERKPFISSTPKIDRRERTIRRDKEPMKFNGRTDWKDYLGHFSAVAHWNGWSYEELGLQLAIGLTDDAREVLSSLPADYQHDYHTLKDALTNRFSPEGRESHYSLQLMNLACGPDESVTSYGQSLRRLASRAYPNQTVDERILVDLYIKGLPNKDMKRHVYLERPISLSQAIHFAVAFEAFDAPLGEKLAKPRVNVAAVKSQEDDQITKLTNLVTKLSDKVDQIQQNSTSQKGTCFRCGSVSHYAKNCRMNSGNNNYSAPRQGNYGYETQQGRQGNYGYETQQGRQGNYGYETQQSRQKNYGNQTRQGHLN